MRLFVRSALREEWSPSFRTIRESKQANQASNQARSKRSFVRTRPFGQNRATRFGSIQRIVLVVLIVIFGGGGGNPLYNILRQGFTILGVQGIGSTRHELQH